MKWNSTRKLRQGMLLVVMSLTLCTSSGCVMYDWLVSWIQRSFAEDHDYAVSVVDCKHFQVPGEVFEMTSSLSQKINVGIRQGVKDVSLNQKTRNVQLVDNIPREEFVKFQDGFFGEKVTYDDRTTLLRKYCENYNTNIIMWGATMGDDFTVAFVGFMYRRDLDVTSTTEPIPLEKETSERIQEKKIQDAMKNLLEKSLDSDPIGITGGIAKDLSDNKESILSGVTMLLFYVLQSSAEE